MNACSILMAFFVIVHVTGPCTKAVVMFELKKRKRGTHCDELKSPNFLESN